MQIKNIPLFIIVLTLLGPLAHAQIEKGSRLVGGYGSVQFNDPYIFNAVPNMGIFVTDRLVLGSTLNLKFMGYENYSGVSAGLVPFARYYFGRGQSRIFAVAGMGYRGNWEINSAVEGTRKREFYGSLSGDLGIGYTRLITDQVGLEAILNFSGINLGFQIYLPRE